MSGHRPAAQDKPLRIAMGVRLAMLRKAREMSQEELAKICLLSTSSISRIEKGMLFVTLPTLFRIAAFLEVEPAKLMPDLEDLHNAGYGT